MLLPYRHYKDEGKKIFWGVKIFIVFNNGFLFFSTPEGLEDVSKYPDLLAALLEDPTWSEEDVKKLAGLNLLRVFAQVEEVRFFS